MYFWASNVKAVWLSGTVHELMVVSQLCNEIEEQDGAVVDVLTSSPLCTLNERFWLHTELLKTVACIIKSGCLYDGG